MTLWFGTHGKRRIIANPATVEDAYVEIKKFCDERNFKIYYVRQWQEPETNQMCFDVGSHTEFFWLGEH